MAVDYLKFATRVKEKYPEYADVDDVQLTRRILEKYPEYSTTVDTTSFPSEITPEAQPQPQVDVAPVAPEEPNVDEQQFLPDSTPVSFNAQPVVDPMAAPLVVEGPTEANGFVGAVVEGAKDVPRSVVAIVEGLQKVQEVKYDRAIANAPKIIDAVGRLREALADDTAEKSSKPTSDEEKFLPKSKVVNIPGFDISIPIGASRKLLEGDEALILGATGATSLDDVTPEMLTNAIKTTKTNLESFSKSKEAVKNSAKAANDLRTSGFLKEKGYADMSGVAGFFQDVVRNAPNLGATVALSLVNPVAGATLASTQIGGGQLASHLDEGLDPERAMDAALINTLVQMPLERIGLGKMAKHIKGSGLVGKITRSFIETGLTEFLTETAQGFEEAAVDIWAKSKGKTVAERFDNFKKNFRDIAGKAFYSGLVGMFTGSAIAAGGRAARGQQDGSAKLADKKLKSMFPDMTEVEIANIKTIMSQIEGQAIEAGEPQGNEAANEPISERDVQAQEAASRTPQEIEKAKFFKLQEETETPGEVVSEVVQEGVPTVEQPAIPEADVVTDQPVVEEKVVEEPSPDAVVESVLEPTKEPGEEELTPPVTEESFPVEYSPEAESEAVIAEEQAEGVDPAKIADFERDYNYSKLAKDGIAAEEKLLEKDHEGAQAAAKNEVLRFENQVEVEGHSTKLRSELAKTIKGNQWKLILGIKNTVRDGKPIYRTKEVEAQLQAIADGLNETKSTIEETGTRGKDAPPQAVLDLVDHWSADDVADLAGNAMTRSELNKYKTKTKAKIERLDRDLAAFEEQANQRGQDLERQKVNLGMIKFERIPEHVLDKKYNKALRRILKDREVVPQSTSRRNLIKAIMQTQETMKKEIPVESTPERNQKTKPKPEPGSPEAKAETVVKRSEAKTKEDLSVDQKIARLESEIDELDKRKDDIKADIKSKKITTPGAVFSKGVVIGRQEALAKIKKVDLKKNIDLKRLKERVTDYARNKSIPIADKRLLLSNIKSLKTRNQALRLVEKVDKIEAKFEKNKAIVAVNKAIDSIPGSLSKALGKSISERFGKIDIGRAELTEKAKNKIKALRSHLKTQLGFFKNEPEIKALIEKVDGALSEAGNLKRLNTEQLQSIVEDINEITRRAEFKYVKTSPMTGKTHSESAEIARDNILKSKTLKGRKKSKKPQKEVIIGDTKVQGKGLIKTLGKFWGIESDIPELISERAEGMDIDDKNATYSPTIYGGLNDGSHAEKRGSLDRTEALQNKLSFLGLTGKKLEAASEWLGQKNAVKKTFTLENGKKIALTIGQRMDVYNHLKNDHNTQALLDNDITLDSVFMEEKLTTEEKSASVTEADLDAIVKDIPARYKELADWMMVYLERNSSPLINKTSMSINGFDMATVENYWGLLRTDIYKNFLGEASSPGDLNDNVVQSLESAGWTKERSGKAKGSVVIRDAFRAFGDMTNIAITYNAFAERLRFMKQMQLDTKVAFQERGNLEDWNALNTAISDIEGMMADRTTGNEKLINTAISNVQKNILGFNPYVVAKQLASYPFLFVEFDEVHVLAALQAVPGFVGGNRAKTRAEMKRASIELYDRIMTGSLSIEMGGKTNRVKSQQMYGIEHFSFSEWSTGAIKTADELVINIAWDAAKRQIAANTDLKGKAKEAAVGKLAEKAVRRTQPTFDNKDRSQISRKRSIPNRLLFPFTSVPNKMLSTIRRSHLQYVRGKQTAGDKAKLMRDVFLYVLIPSTAIMRAVNGANARNRDYGEEKDGWDKLNEWIQGTLSVHYLAPRIVDAGYRFIRGFTDGPKRAFGGNSGNLLDSKMASIGRDMERLTSAIRDEDLSRGRVDRFMDGAAGVIDGVAALTTGVPVKNVYRAGKDAVKLLAGHEKYKSEADEEAQKQGYRPTISRDFVRDGETGRESGTMNEKLYQEFLGGIHDHATRILTDNRQINLLSKKVAQSIGEKGVKRYTHLSKEGKTAVMKLVFRRAKERAKQNRDYMKAIEKEPVSKE